MCEYFRDHKPDNFPYKTVQTTESKMKKTLLTLCVVRYPRELLSFLTVSSFTAPAFHLQNCPDRANCTKFITL